jgi:hypothetical protein
MRRVLVHTGGVVTGFLVAALAVEGILIGARGDWISFALWLWAGGNAGGDGLLATVPFADCGLDSTDFSVPRRDIDHMDCIKQG